MTQVLFRAYWKSLTALKEAYELPKGNFYQRLQKRDFNRMAAIPCIVDPVNPSDEDIETFKQNRANLGIREEIICPQCPRNKTCKFAFKQPDAETQNHLQLSTIQFYFDKLNSDIKINVVDEKHYWFGTMRVLDSFHQIVLDQLNNNGAVNAEFLEVASEYDKIEKLDVHPKQQGKGVRSVQDSKTYKQKYSKPSDSTEEPQTKKQDYYQDYKDTKRSQPDEQERRPYQRQQRYGQDENSVYQYDRQSSYDKPRKSYDRQSSQDRPQYEKKSYGTEEPQERKERYNKPQEDSSQRYSKSTEQQGEYKAVPKASKQETSDEPQGGRRVKRGKFTIDEE